jgi:hypothetical protein
MDMPADQYALYAEFGIAAEKAQVLAVAAGNVALGFLAIAELKDIQNKLDVAHQFLDAMATSLDGLAVKLGRSPVDAADTALRLHRRGKRVDI